MGAQGRRAAQQVTKGGVLTGQNEMFRGQRGRAHKNNKERS